MAFAGFKCQRFDLESTAKIAKIIALWLPEVHPDFGAMTKVLCWNELIDEWGWIENREKDIDACWRSGFASFTAINEFRWIQIRFKSI